MPHTTMNMEFPQELVLFDFEYTAWEGSQERDWSNSGEYREIIQIGAIRISAPDLSEMKSFSEYVKPEKNPQLSEFIMRLTGITQADIDTQGMSFPDALKKFEHFVGDTYAYCWGRDIEVLRENATFSNIDLSFTSHQLINLRPLMAPLFLLRGVDIDKHSSGTLIQAFTDRESRAAHDALNDMRNLLDAIREVREYITVRSH